MQFVLLRFGVGTATLPEPIDMNFAGAGNVLETGKQNR